MKLTVDKILLEHDIPLLLTAKLEERIFLCTAIHIDDSSFPFLCVEITKGCLKRIVEGKKDIYEVVKNPLFSGWWLGNLGKDLEVEKVNLKKEWLPGKGFYL